MSSNAVSNGRVRIRPGLARLMATEPEQIAEGVWVMRGGFPLKSMNVYFVRDGDGVLLFDAGISDMTAAVARGAAQLGGLTRIVLGHGHPDHRGVAPGLQVPTYCHPDEVADAEGDGGSHYFTLGRARSPRALPARLVPSDVGRRPGEDRRDGERGR